METLYPKRNQSLANQNHKVYPYLLRGLEIDRPNQVWSTDITYVPMVKGFIYLIAVLDWYSRKVLSWRVSTSMDTSFCIDSREEAIETYGAQKYSIPIRAVSLPVRSSLVYSKPMTSPSAWTAKDVG